MHVCEEGELERQQVQVLRMLDLLSCQQQGAMEEFKQGDVQM